jgi:hypothetical protein
MDVTNIFHFYNILSKLKKINKEKKLKELVKINFDNINFNKIKKCKKTLFVCSHDYCFADIISIYLLGIKTNLLNNTYIIARKDFGYLIPGIKLIDRENTTEKMINILKNNDNIIVFYSRIHIEKLNIDRIIEKVDIHILPVKIDCKTLDPVSHNIDGVLENIDIYLHNIFNVKVLDLIDYDKNFKKQDFISKIKNVLYADGGYFNEKDIFIKKQNHKVNNGKLIII